MSHFFRCQQLWRSMVHLGMQNIVQTLKKQQIIKIRYCEGFESAAGPVNEEQLSF